MMKILASAEFSEWLFALAPQPKRRFRLALRNLEKGKGDIKPLQGSLEGFCRLRVGGMRILFRYQGSQTVYVEYGNTRDAVYELFQQYLEK
jgi:mRNA-degrading endonuclease RelE of RelBE toxin-antitoxin system